jgi:hypothetical protein
MAATEAYAFRCVRETSGDHSPEPTDEIPHAFKIGAVLFFVLLIVIAVLLTPGVPIPD